MSGCINWFCTCLLQLLIARLLRVAAALDACWVAGSLGRSGPFQQCKKNWRAKSAALEIIFETWCYGAPTTEG